MNLHHKAESCKSTSTRAILKIGVCVLKRFVAPSCFIFQSTRRTGSRVLFVVLNEYDCDDDTYTAHSRWRLEQTSSGDFTSNRGRIRPLENINSSWRQNLTCLPPPTLSIQSDQERRYLIKQPKVKSIMGDLIPLNFSATTAQALLPFSQKQELLARWWKPEEVRPPLVVGYTHCWSRPWGQEFPSSLSLLLHLRIKVSYLGSHQDRISFSSIQTTSGCPQAQSIRISSSFWFS